MSPTQRVGVFPQPPALEEVKSPEHHRWVRLSQYLLECIELAQQPFQFVYVEAEHLLEISVLSSGHDTPDKSQL